MMNDTPFQKMLARACWRLIDKYESSMTPEQIERVHAKMKAAPVKTGKDIVETQLECALNVWELYRSEMTDRQLRELYDEIISPEAEKILEKYLRPLRDMVNEVVH